MITLRNGTAAFLRNNGNILLIKRAGNRVILPGVWSGVGGHMEPGELNNPSAACIREIEEETGIASSDINGLELLYVILRRFNDEIRQSYIYFGETSKTGVVQTDEGELFWVSENELLEREFSATFTAMLEHYIKRDRDDRAVYAGVAGNDGGRLRMVWARCEDFG
ncbi:MAG: NUDIX hydrolase [Clostridiales bacterium]|jgi:8-oxo-dGTP diphosphatase|nr:NUDIX hydrolase [Clostridiales bacterium]